jgi:hypothetical protein
MDAPAWLQPCISGTGQHETACLTTHRIARAAWSYARAASSAVSNVPSHRRAPTVGSRISAAHLPQGRCRTPLQQKGWRKSKQMAMKCGLSSACLNVLVLLVDGRSSAAVIDLAAFAGTCDFPACESPGSSGRDAVRNSTDAMQGQRKLRWAKEETRHNFANMQITCQGARPEGSWRCHT